MGSVNTKNHYRKRLLAFSLAALFAVTALCVGSLNAFAASTDSTTATKGVYWFDPHEVGMDLTDNYIYDEELLKGNSLEYNPKLATMTFQLAVSSIVPQFNLL